MKFLTLNLAFESEADEIISLQLPEVKTATSGLEEFYVDHFLACFDMLRYHGPVETDRFEAEGKGRLAADVRYFVAENKPIRMILPAFPCKSSNRAKKVFGTLPDRGEELALQRLDQFCEEVAVVYPPGCKLVIMSDGRVFGDLVQVPDSDVDAYAEELAKLGPFRHLSFDCLDNHVPSGKSKDFDKIRSELVSRIGQTFESLAAQVGTKNESWDVYAGFVRFLEYDLSFGTESEEIESSLPEQLKHFLPPAGQKLSRRKKRSLCAEIAGFMMVRNVTFSKLIEDVFPTHVRLSIHAHPNCGPKYGVLLLGDLDRCSTPWHNVVVNYRDGKNVLMKKCEAEEMAKEGALELVSHPTHGRPWYFRQN